MNLVTLDFETYFDPKTYSLSRKDCTTESYIRDPRFRAHGAGIKINDKPTRWFTASKLSSALAAIPWDKCAMLGHNLAFDGGIASWHYGAIPKLYIDTLGMARALIGPNTKRHGLKYVAESLLNKTKMQGLDVSQGKRVLSAHEESIIADYCTGLERYNPETNMVEAGDCELTYEIFKRMAPHFPKQEYKVLDWSVRAFTAPKFVLDADMLQEHLYNVRENKKRHLVEVYVAIGGKPSNASELSDEDHAKLKKHLRSAPKFGSLLTHFGALIPTKINDKGEVKAAFAKTDSGLQELLEHPSARVRAVVEARIEVQSSIEESRTQRFLDASTRGLFPVPNRYAGAMVTQRDSGSDGMNMYNLPRPQYDAAGAHIEGTGMLRLSLCARPGKKLAVADLSQIEARFTLWYGMQMPRSNGGEYEALQKLANGEDLYSWFGGQAYGHEISKKTHPTERQISKSAVLGLGFQMGAARFIDYCRSSGIVISPQMAQALVTMYRNMFKGVVQSWFMLDRSAKAFIADADRYDIPLLKWTRDPLYHQPALVRPSGLMLKYPDLRLGPDGLEYVQGAKVSKQFGGKFLENAAQSICRDVLKAQKVEIISRYPVLSSTYDEVVVEFDDDPETEREVVAFLNKCMTRPIPYLPGLPLATEVDTGYRYGDAK